MDNEDPMNSWADDNDGFDDDDFGDDILQVGVDVRERPSVIKIQCFIVRSLMRQVTFWHHKSASWVLLLILFFIQQVDEAERSYIESDMQQNDDEEGTRNFRNIQLFAVHHFINQRETFLILFLFNRYDTATS